VSSAAFSCSIDAAGCAGAGWDGRGGAALCSAQGSEEEEKGAEMCTNLVAKERPDFNKSLNNCGLGRCNP